MNKNYKTAIILGSGFFGISAVWAAYNSFVPVILKNFAFSNAMIGLFMTIDNILAVTVQPVIGTLSDRTNTRIGRRKPYIIAGFPIAVLCFALIPFIQSIFILAIVIFLLNLFMALYRSPMIALMPDIFEPSQRSSANGIINLMGGLGALLAFFAAGSLFDLDKRWAFIFISIVLFIANMILICFIKEKDGNYLRDEKKESDRLPGSSALAFMIGGAVFALFYFGGFFQKTIERIFISQIEGALIIGIITFAFILYKTIAHEIDRRTLTIFFAIFLWFFGYNAIETFFTLFCTKEMGISTGKATFLLGLFSISFIIGAIPSGMLSKKVGRYKMILYGLAILALISILICLASGVGTIAFLMFIGGSAWAMVNINAYPVICDAASSGSLGKFTGYYYFFSMLAQSLSPPLNGFVIDLTGSYKTAFMIAAMFFIFAAFLFRLLMKKNTSENESIAT
jgi:maltose/moltooligosaccharide transporter